MYEIWNGDLKINTTNSRAEMLIYLEAGYTVVDLSK